MDLLPYAQQNLRTLFRYYGRLQLASFVISRLLTADGTDEGTTCAASHISVAAAANMRARRAQGYTGLIVGGGLGGFQTVLRAPADFAYPIPDGLASSHAAPLLCAGITVYAPLKRYLAGRPGARAAVVGVGGLGHLAVQFAAAMGAVVTAIDR